MTMNKKNIWRNNQKISNKKMTFKDLIENYINFLKQIKIF